MSSNVFVNFQRAGYTIAELIRLASSTVPAQRRLALSTLTRVLKLSRRGCHAVSLATQSVLPPMLAAEAGICFLLRWSLDHAVSELTRQAGAGGASSAVLAETFNAMAALLVDERGEVSLKHCIVITVGGVPLKEVVPLKYLGSSFTVRDQTKDGIGRRSVLRLFRTAKPGLQPLGMP